MVKNTLCKFDPFFLSHLLATGQSMGPRPSMGVPGPRAMPPYKYATGVRNPNPQVVQPIALQQVQQKRAITFCFVDISSL